MKEKLQEKLDLEQLSRLTQLADKVPDLFMKAGVAYIGIKATGHWTGALTALVALRLAQANNLAAGAAGVTALTGIGLGSIGVLETGGLFPTQEGGPYWLPFQGGLLTQPGGLLNPK